MHGHSMSHRDAYSSRRLIERYGLEVLRSRNHLICRHPLGFRVVLPKTGTDRRGLLNAEALIRRRIRAALPSA